MFDNRNCIYGGGVKYHTFKSSLYYRGSMVLEQKLTYMENNDLASFLEKTKVICKTLIIEL